jgi:probable HAF family extracellular repeat protein
MIMGSHSTIQRSFSIFLIASLLVTLGAGVVPATRAQTAQTAPVGPATSTTTTTQSVYMPLVIKAPALPGSTVTGVIPPAGGGLTATALDGTVLTLIFPAGAVPDPLTVTLTPGSAPAGAWADFTVSPAGYIFGANVTLTLLAPAGVTLTSSAALYYNPAGQPVYLPISVDVAGRTLTASLTSLGLPALGASNQADRLQTAADDSTELIAETQSQVNARIAEAQAQLNAMLAANDFAHALPLQMSIIALLQSFGASEPTVLAWVTSASNTACSVYGQAAAYASATPVTDFGQIYGLVSPVLEWEAITQKLGASPCPGQPGYQTVLDAKTTELKAVIQAKLPVVAAASAENAAGAASTTAATASYDEDFADAQPEVQDLSNLERQSYAMLLIGAPASIDTGAQQPLLEQVRDSAYSQCHASTTPLQKYLGQYLATVKADLSGTERSSLVEALQKDIQYCGSSLYYRGRDGIADTFGSITHAGLGTPLGGGATPGSQTASAEERTHVQRELDLAAQIQSLQCPDGSVGADQISLSFDGHTIWTGPVADFNYEVDPHVGYTPYSLKNLVQQAGGDPASATSGNLEIQRSNTACAGAYDTSLFDLFTLNFTFGGCVPPAGYSYCVEAQWDQGLKMPYKVLADDSKIYLTTLSESKTLIERWDGVNFTTLATLNNDEDVLLDVNDQGHVFGYHQISHNSSCTDYYWILKDGLRQEIRSPAGHTLGCGHRPETYPAINNADQVVFRDYIDWSSTIGREHVFLWQNGSISDLGDLGGPCVDYWGCSGAFPIDINNAGQITGTAWTLVPVDDPYCNPSCTPRVFISIFVWNGSFSTIFAPIEDNSLSPVAINDVGHILYNKITTLDFYLWSNAVETQILPLAGCFGYSQVFFNNSDIVVGIALGNCPSSNASIIWQNGQATELTSLVKLPEDFGYGGYAPIINQAGILIATASKSGTEWSYDFLYPAGQ